MKVNVSKNVLQGSIWGILWKMLSIIFPFVIRTIIIKKLGSDYSGLNSLFSSVLNVLNLADLGIGAAMVFAMYKPIAEDNVEKICNLLNFYRKAYLVIGTIVLGVGLSLMPFLGYLISGDVPEDINIYALFLIYLANSVSTYFFLAYYSSILFAHQRQADYSMILFYVHVISYGLQVVSLLLLNSYYLYILLLPVSTVVGNFAVYLFVRKKYPSIRPKGTIEIKEKKEIRKNVTSLFVYKIGGVFGNSIDSIIISAFLGLILTSNYNNYYYILNAVSGLIIIVFNSLTAGIGNKLIHNSAQQNVKDFSFILSINAFIVVVCTTCMFGLYQDFISFWLGDEYLLPFGLMVCFCFYFFVHIIRKTCVTYRDAAGMWRDTMFLPIVSASINLVLDIVLIQIIGLYGVIIATIACMLFIELPWEAILLLKNKINYPIKNYFLRIVNYSICAGLSCFMCHMLTSCISVSNIYLRLFIDLTVSIICANLMFSIMTIYEENTFKKIIFFFIDRIKRIR